jgi:hypothetical protein
MSGFASMPQNNRFRVEKEQNRGCNVNLRDHGGFDCGEAVEWVHSVFHRSVTAPPLALRVFAGHQAMLSPQARGCEALIGTLSSEHDPDRAAIIGAPW